MDARDELVLTVTAEAAKVATVRRAARDFAESHGSRRSADVAMAVSEAAANVVLHAYRDRSPGPLHLTGCREDGFLELAIADDGCGMPDARIVHRPGHGLHIMAQLASRLEITERAPGMRVRMRFGVDAPAEQQRRFARMRDEIATAVAHGADLRQVERRLAAEPLDADRADALWLGAWSTIDRR